MRPLPRATGGPESRPWKSAPSNPPTWTCSREIDGTIDSTQYVHVERGGEGLALAWKLQERPLRERLARSNPIDDERRFWLKQIATGADEGLALMAEHEGVPVALVVASPGLPAPDDARCTICGSTSTTAARAWPRPCSTR